MLAAPLIGDGNGFTVMITDAMQPPAIVYVTIEVPAFIPVTLPMLFTVATDVGALFHVPPVVASFKVVVDVTQIFGVPEIVAGVGFTVTTAVTVHPVPNE